MSALKISFSLGRTFFPSAETRLRLPEQASVFWFLIYKNKFYDFNKRCNIFPAPAYYIVKGKKESQIKIKYKGGNINGHSDYRSHSCLVCKPCVCLVTSVETSKRKRNRNENKTHLSSLSGRLGRELLYSQKSSCFFLQKKL